MIVATAAAQPMPFPNGEILRYNANWPSGLSLGESQLTARQTPGGEWNFELTLEASIPGFQVIDRYRSQATGALCSEALEKQIQHGKRKAREQTLFDRASGKAKRKTLPDGGTTELASGACGRDALTFLYQIRRELAAGRLPAAGTVYFGAPYQVSFAHGGLQKVQGQDADRLIVTARGPASESKFEMWFARDAARTFLQAKAPLAMGSFSLEIAR
jgi:hypothetical protein